MGGRLEEDGVMRLYSGTDIDEQSRYSNRVHSNHIAKTLTRRGRVDAASEGVDDQEEVRSLVGRVGDCPVKISTLSYPIHENRRTSPHPPPLESIRARPRSRGNADLSDHLRQKCAQKSRSIAVPEGI